MTRVLVVEDEHAICALISDILESADIETKCVKSDVEAYAELPTLPTYKALIVDINLGKGTTGFDVARFARQVVPHLPVIYVTGEADQESFRAFGVPDSDFLEKPFTPEELLGIVKSRLEDAIS